MTIYDSLLDIANIAIVFKTITHAITPIIVRFAHKTATSHGTKFHSTSVVCVTEITKIVISFLVLCIIHRTPSKLNCVNLYQGFIVNKVECLKMCVPSIIYFVQTNLYYIALHKLNAAVFTVTYQLRIITIGVLAVCILKKTFTFLQWGALFICFIGVIGVHSDKFDGGGDYFDRDKVDQLVGIGLVLAMCWMSAFAGVYLEKVLKTSDDDLWLQNIRLSSIALVISLGYIGHSYIREDKCWNEWNWTAAFAMAFGGLITSAVLKYADNIRKSFCQSLAICGTAFLSIALGDSPFAIGLAFGTTLVVISIFMYTFGTGKKEDKENEQIRIEIDGSKELDLTESSKPLLITQKETNNCDH